MNRFEIHILRTAFHTLRLARSPDWREVAHLLRRHFLIRDPTATSPLRLLHPDVSIDGDGIRRLDSEVEIFVAFWMAEVDTGFNAVAALREEEDFSALPTAGDWMYGVPS